MIKKYQRKNFSLLVLYFTCLLFPINTIAENMNSISSGSEKEEWSYSLTPYLWVTGLKGKVATLPPAAPAELDISFSDVVDNMDMSLMGFFEARKGRLGLFSEVFYIGVSSEGADTPGPFYSETEYEQDLWAMSFGASYALTENENYRLDAVGGLRFWDLDNELKLKAGILPAKKRSDHESWQDVFIGLKGNIQLNQQWFLSGWGITTVAGDSDSAWDVFGAVGYHYSEAIAFTAGYRHQEVDYDKGDFLFDVEMSGPTLGITFRF